MKRFLFAMTSLCLLASLLVAQQPEENQPVQAPDNGDLAAQIQQLRADVERLSQQVDRLNDDVTNLQSSGSAPPVRPTTRRKSTTVPRAPAAPQPATVASSSPTAGDEPNPITTLVFKDRKRVETRNYAIVGESVWVYTETESKKYRLDDLDVDATKKVNLERGVSFQLPPSR